MTGARARRRRRGRHLPARPAAELLGCFPDIKVEHERLAAIGFRLMETMRPYLRKDGRVTLVFVWLKRDHDRTTTLRHVVRIEFGRVKPWVT